MHTYVYIYIYTLVGWTPPSNPATQPLLMLVLLPELLTTNCIIIITSHPATQPQYNLM